MEKGRDTEGLEHYLGFPTGKATCTNSKMVLTGCQKLVLNVSHIWTN